MMGRNDAKSGRRQLAKERNPHSRVCRLRRGTDEMINFLYTVGFASVLALCPVLARADDAPVTPAADAVPAAAAPATSTAPPAVAPPAAPIPAPPPPANPAPVVPPVSPPAAASQAVVTPPVVTMPPTTTPRASHSYHRVYRHWRRGHPLKHETTTPGDAPAR
jgi:hypothetical protein